MARQAMPVQTGKVIDYINSGETKINVGDVVPLISLCGIAETDIEAVSYTHLQRNGDQAEKGHEVNPFIRKNLPEVHAGKKHTRNNHTGRRCV